MPISDYVRGLRQRVGSDLLFLPGVSAVVTNAAGEILLQRRSDFGTWSLLGGILDPGEEPADGVVREVFEETAVAVEPVRITGVYTTPAVRYPNGDQALYVITCFLCRAVGGPGPRVNDDESLEVRYFSPASLPEMRPDHRVRIGHALSNREPAFFNRTIENPHAT
jgi:ADP-ribose pyrophosphatase YjhB (NUDIX family)